MERDSQAGDAQDHSGASAALSRRVFLKFAGLQTAGLKAAQMRAAEARLVSLGPATHKATPTATTAKADYTLRIAPMSLELAPGVVVKTTAFNGTVPGPLLRVKEGVPVTIDVFNDSPADDLTHWHGLAIDALNDGAMEQGSPMNRKGGHLRYSFTPAPSGTRWYHSHASAGMDTGAGGYSGQFGFLCVEPRSHAGAYDREVLLAIHHWEATIAASSGPRGGQEVTYKYASFNGRLASASEPIRVRQGERVLFRLLNASATQSVSLSLPGHLFEVIALDGNSVPSPRKVSTVSLGVAERVDTIVEMTNAGVWMLGSNDDAERAKGLGVTIEYAGARGAAVWTAPETAAWSYAQFGDKQATQYVPEKTIPLMIAVERAEDGGMDRWTVNGKSFPDVPVIQVEKGKRYRLSLMNTSAETHPMHLHRHSFEITSIAGVPVSGVRKDTVNVEPWKKVEIDFVADNPGKTLFHCHQQLHMDCGLMQLIDYV